MSSVPRPASPPAPAHRARAGWLRRLLLVAGGAVAAVVLSATLMLLAVWLSWLADPARDQRSRGVNALWAAHTWVGDPHSDAEYRALAALLEKHEISDVFFHAGPLDGDGSVPAGLTTQTATLLAAMERYAPDVRTQAYLGQIEDRGGGSLDLDDPLVRQRILDTAERFLDMGFGGIHYDIEPIFPGDESFLALLEGTRALTEPRGAVLSVALEQMEIAPGVQRAVASVLPGYHDPTAAFLRDVAKQADQVAIMTYDSGLPVDWLFGTFVAWQTRLVVDAIGDDATIFIGIPTYDEGSAWRFHPRAENVQSSVRGVRKGLDRLDPGDTQDVGIAIFAEWTTTPEEWDAIWTGWVRD